MEIVFSSEARYCGTDGTVKVHGDGSVRFTNLSGDEVIESWSCFGKKQMAAVFRGSDVIGATVVPKDSMESIYINYCPDKPGKDKRMRVLERGGPFTLENGRGQELVDTIRSKNMGLRNHNSGAAAVLAIVNPQSGKKRAEETWGSAKSLVEAAGLGVDTVSTTHPGHATEHVSSLDLDAYACIIAVGGDGIVHEIVQGLRRHLKMPESFKMPLCHVPAGSGNGIAATCGLWTPVTAMHAVIKGHVGSWDAASVVTPSEAIPRLSVLGVQYGLLADLDIGTEHLRKILGGERFTYGAVREILKWSKHEAYIAYQSGAAEEVDLATMKTGVLECPSLLSVQNGDLDFKNPTSWPEGWTIEKQDSIRYLNLAGPSWAALDAKINPWGNVSDGCWEFATDKCQSRMQGLKMILETQAGNHADSELFDMHRVSAFVMEPINKTSYLTVDGEQLPVERVAVEVHRKLLRFIQAPTEAA